MILAQLKFDQVAMLCFTVEDSWADIREREDARKCAVFGEAGEKCG